MTSWQKLVAVAAIFGLLATAIDGVMISPAAAESEGKEELFEAIQLKANAQGLQDISKVVELLESALNKGLDLEDAEFAESMLSGAMMERATILMQVVNTQSIRNPKVQQVRRLIVSDLRSVLAYDDPPANAHLMLGRLMALPGGDRREALRSLSNFLEAEDLRDDQKAEAYALRGRVQTDEAKSLADFDEAVKLAPNNDGYRLIRAIFLRGRHKLEEALAEVDVLLEKSPQDANALILQGEVLRELGKMDEALKSFDQATELAPQAPGPFQNRGEIFREQEKYEEAIAQFNKVLELQPDGLLPLLHRAQAYLYSGQLNEALADVERALEKQPLIAAHRLRAEILAKMDRLPQAIEEMERVAEAMPKQPDLKFQLAVYYGYNQQPRKAIEAFSDVIEMDANNFYALQRRGDTYLNIGDHASALADLEAALKLEPEDSSILNNLSWLLSTSPEDSIRDGKRAIELATKACELTDYSMPHILSTLAAGYAESGNFEEAIKWSQKAVDMEDPEHGAQLAEELASYQEGKPWRERQTMDEKPATEAEAPAQESEQATAPK